MTDVIDIIDQKQLKFEERIQSNIQVMVGTLTGCPAKPGQTTAAIAAMQDKNQATNSKIIAVLEQMKVTLSKIQAQISLATAKKSVPSVSEINK